MITIKWDEEFVIAKIQKDAIAARMHNDFLSQMNVDWERSENPWRFLSREWSIWESAYSAMKG